MSRWLQREGLESFCSNFRPAFIAMTGRVTVFVNLLGSFAGFSTAVEPRHRSWDDNLDVLEETNSIPVSVECCAWNLRIHTEQPSFKFNTQRTIHI